MTDREMVRFWNAVAALGWDEQGGVDGALAHMEALSLSIRSPRLATATIPEMRKEIARRRLLDRDPMADVLPPDEDGDATVDRAALVDAAMAKVGRVGAGGRALLVRLTPGERNALRARGAAVWAGHESVRQKIVTVLDASPEPLGATLIANLVYENPTPKQMNGVREGLCSAARDGVVFRVARGKYTTSPTDATVRYAQPKRTGAHVGVRAQAATVARIVLAQGRSTPRSVATALYGAETTPLQRQHVAVALGVAHANGTINRISRGVYAPKNPA